MQQTYVVGLADGKVLEHNHIIYVVGLADGKVCIC